MRQNRTALVRGYYFCYFAAQGCMASCLNVFLRQTLHLDGRALGWFNGGTTLCAAAVLPLVGLWADRTGRPGRLLTLALGALTAGGTMLGLQSGFWGALGWGILWECARSSCVPLADRSTVGLCGAQSYGKLRCFGSLGFLAGGAGLGVLTRRWGLERLLFPIYLSLAAAALLLSFGLHREENVRREPPKRVWRTLLHTPAVRLALLLGAQGGAAVNALQPYLGGFLVDRLGASVSALGWNTLLCVGPELLLLPWVSGRLLPKYGAARVSLGLTLALSMRCIGYALAPNMGIFLAASLFYGCTVCAATAVSLNVLRAAVSEECYATAVLLSAAVTALTRAGFGWLFGMLEGTAGGRAGFWLLGALSLAAAWVLWKKRDVLPNESAGH